MQRSSRRGAEAIFGLGALGVLALVLLLLWLPETSRRELEDTAAL